MWSPTLAVTSPQPREKAELLTTVGGHACRYEYVTAFWNRPAHAMLAALCPGEHKCAPQQRTP